MNLRRAVAVAVICFSSVLCRADVKVGDKPTLRFKDFLTKKNVDLADLHGKIIVVDFWATWCKPCMAEADHLVAVNTKYADKGVQFIGVTLDSDPNATKTVMADKKFTWPMLFEAGAGTTPAAWGITSIPQTFIIGPDGDVLWRGYPNSIDAALDDALKNHPPQLVDPKILAQAKTALDQIEKDLDDQQPAKALKLLATVPDAAKLDGDVASRLTAATAKLTDFGNAQLADIDPLIQSAQYSTAIQKLRDLSQEFTGTPVAVAAKTKLASLGSDPKVKQALESDKAEKEAADLLTVANKLKADKKDELAYPRFKAIVKMYPKTTAATEAAGDVKTYEADKAFMARLTAKANSKKAESMLSMADNYRASGNTELAKKKYQEVIEAFPDTEWAATASKGLAAMGN